MELKNAKTFTLILTLLSFLNLSFASKILIVIPLTSVSEQNIYTPLANALSKRGHEVTVVTRKMPSSDLDPGIQKVLMGNLNNYLADFGDPVESRKLGWAMAVTMEFDFLEDACHRVYKDPQFLPLFQKKRFDVIFSNGFFHTCFYPLYPKYQPGVPIIQITTCPPLGYHYDLMGARMATSFIPNSFLSVTDKMGFVDRWWNTVLDHYYSLRYKWIVIPGMDAVAREYLGNDIPSALDVERNASLMFSNTHIAITPPRPLLPDVIEIAGLHCRPPKPLPKDLDEFLSGAEHGFIYFSMGSVLQGHQFPKEIKQMFLRVFSKLKQRVLWKYEADELAEAGLEIPKNLKVSKWLPQQDVLGHKNIKLFITHSGMFSTLEAIYHGVPLIGLPIFVDQNMNIHQAAERGFAIKLEILGLTQETLEKAMTDVLSNQSFEENAKLVSSVFRDQIEAPIERAMYWTEYVIKYKGATHLRSSSRDLNFIQYHSFDVYLSILISSLLILILVGKTLCLVHKFIFCGKGNTKERLPKTKKYQ